MFYTRICKLTICSRPYCILCAFKISTLGIYRNLYQQKKGKYDISNEFTQINVNWFGINYLIYFGNTSKCFIK